MRSALFALAAASVFASAAQAAPATYAIDPTHTFATFEIDHFGASTNRARFDKKSGSVQFDKAGIEFAARFGRSAPQWALVSGGAGKVAILSYTMPFWVVIFAALFLGERLRRGQYFAILIAAFGLFLVLQPWQLDFSSMKSAMLAILSGVSWGASAIVAKRLYARHPRVDLLSLTSWQMLYAALVMSVVALLVPQREIDWQPTVFWALAYSAILATALAWSLWLFVLKNLPASIASLSTLAVPVCGVLFSWWLLGENPGAVEGSGIVLIVLALALVSRKKKEAVSVKRI